MAGLIFSALTWISCEKEGSPVAPSIVLLGTPGAITTDTIAAKGDTLHFHLRAKPGSELLRLFQVNINGQVARDSVLKGEGFELHLYYVKGADSLETITFMVRDRKSQEGSVTVKVTLTGGVSWGPVMKISDATLGAQDNATTGSFYDIENQVVRTLAEAFQHQESVDLLYYYEAGDENTVASPGANLSSSLFTGTYGLSQWTTLRTTRFKKINITLQQFQDCTHDSLLIASYGTVEGNRKAKNLAAGHYYSFLTEDNRYGIFYVKSVTGTETGALVMDILAQQK